MPITITNEEILEKPLRYITLDDVSVLKEMFDEDAAEWLDFEMDMLFHAEYWETKYFQGIEYYPNAYTMVYEISDFLQQVQDRIKRSAEWQNGDHNKRFELQHMLIHWRMAYNFYKRATNNQPQPTKSSAPVNDEADTPAATDGGSTTDTETVEQEEASETDAEKPTDGKNGRNSITVIKPFTDLINDTFNKEKVVEWLHAHTDGKKGQNVAAHFVRLFEDGILHRYPLENEFNAEFPLMKGSFEGVAKCWRQLKDVSEGKERIGIYKMAMKIDYPEFS